MMSLKLQDVWLEYVHFSKRLFAMSLTLYSFKFSKKIFSLKITAIKCQRRFFCADFRLILYKIIIFKNGLDTYHPNSNTSLFCLQILTTACGGHLKTEKKNTLQKLTFQDWEHASEFSKFCWSHLKTKNVIKLNQAS